MPRREVPDPVATKVGARIRELRLERGLSVSALARASGVSPGSLSSIERGLINITLRTVDSLALGLRVSFAALMMFPGDGEFDAVAADLAALPQAEQQEVIRRISELMKSSVPPKTA
jgi:transcriptional regulator with XRE-family HTH domain